MKLIASKTGDKTKAFKRKPFDKNKRKREQQERRRKHLDKKNTKIKSPYKKKIICF
jgi:hypothetical protein